MDKILAALAELKSYFTGVKEALSKVTAAEERAKSLEAELVSEKSKNQSLTEQLQKAQDQVNSQGTEINGLNEKLQAAEKKANEVLASQGITPEQVPPTESNTSTPGNKSETAWDKYNRLRNEDPRAAGEFYSQNAEQIFASRPK